jgi:hypothetical protein
MKGFRTIAFNAGGIALGSGLSYLAGVDWTQFVSPNLAIGIVFAINLGLRFITTGPVGTK